VDSAGVTDQRVNTVRHTIGFTPAGTLSDISSILQDYGATVTTERQPGQSLFKWVSAAITLYATADAGTATTITIASTAGMVVGQYVTISGSNVTGYNGTWMISAVTSSTQLKLAVAFTSNPSTPGVVNYSDTLVVHPLFQSGGTEKIITFQNVALTGLPTLTFSATETILGAVTFTAIYHKKLEAADVDAIVDYRTWSAPISTQLDDFDPDTIYTVPPRMRYGAASVNAWTNSDPVAAPWNDFCTANGATLAMNLATADHVVDSCGLVDIKYTDLSATVTAQPVGELATDEAVQKLLLQQDMGADGRKRGQSMKASTPMELQIRLDGTSTMYFLTDSSAVSAAANNYGTTAMRNGDLVWQALRTFSSGVRQTLIEATVP
jgi:hypothetical protein